MIEFSDQELYFEIKMNRPEVNAIDLSFVESFHSSLDNLETVKNNHPLVIRSSMKEYFSFGFDLPRLAVSEYRYIYKMLSGYLELIRRIVLLPRPVLCLIEGRCIAGGMVLALAADYRISTSNGSRFMLNEVNLNIPFPGGIVALVEGVCGRVTAGEILTGGRSIRPEEALQKKLIHEIVSEDALQDRLMNRVRYFSSKPEFGFKKLKEARMKSIADHIAIDLRREEVYSLLTEITSEDTRKKLSKLLKRLDILGIQTNKDSETTLPAHEKTTYDSGDTRERNESKSFTSRKSTRVFLPKEVSKQGIERILEKALRAPSSKNTQPFKVALLSKMEMEKLSGIFIQNFQKEIVPNPDITPASMTPEMKKRAMELGKEYYEWLGISRKDIPARKEVWMQNYRFWGAPHVLYIYTFPEMGMNEVLDAGIFLGYLLGVLEEEGLGSIPQASLVEYPDVVREVLGINQGIKLLTGVSFGYPDNTSKLNQFQTDRMSVNQLLARSNAS